MLTKRKRGDAMKKVFNEGTVVLFQGDSVTDCSRKRYKKTCLGQGYPKLFKEIYDILFPNNKVTFVNRGVSGDRTADLLRRYDKDFLRIKPDVISIMIGINNTWRNFDSNEAYCSAQQFEKEYEQLLTQIKRDMPETKILIIEQFAFTAHPERTAWQKDLDEKRAVTRGLAEKYADWFIPMYDILTAAAEKDFDLYELSADGVHPAPQGYGVIVSEIFKGLGIL